jgi:hypothetical protein
VLAVIRIKKDGVKTYVYQISFFGGALGASFLTVRGGRDPMV